MISARWLEVTLTEEEDQEAHRIARARRDEAQSGKYRRQVPGTFEEDLLGARGELAVARFAGVRHPGWQGDVSWSADTGRGCDVGGWQVRTASAAHYGLALNEGDTGRFILVLGHEAPRMRLAGWISASEGIKVGALRHDGVGQRDWYRVAQDRLHALVSLPPEESEARPWEAEVRQYLSDCAAARHLKRKHHPTAAGAIKLIYAPQSLTLPTMAVVTRKDHAAAIKTEFELQAGIR